MRNLTILIFSLCCLAIAQAQNNNLSYSLGGGLNLSHADIESDNAFHGSLGVAYRLDDAFDIEVNGLIGSLAGDDRINGETLAFTTSATQIVLRGNLYLLPLFGGTADKIDFFATAGAGVLLSNVTTITTPSNDPWGSEYSGTNLYLPVGGGILLPLSSSFALRFQLLYNVSFTDEIDGYNPRVAANQANDHFTNVGVGITFRPGSKSTPEPEPAIKEEDIISNEDEEEVKESEEQVQEQEQEKQEPIEEPNEQEKEQEGDVEKEQEPDEPSVEENEEPADQPIEGDLGETEGSVFQDPVFNLNGSRANKRYYVIGASFSTMAQSQEYQFEMASLGYATLIITNYEKNIYRISFGAYMALDAAKEQMLKLQKEHDPDTWIIENATQ